MALVSAIHADKSSMPGTVALKVWKSSTLSSGNFLKTFWIDCAVTGCSNRINGGSEIIMSPGYRACFVRRPLPVSPDSNISHKEDWDLKKLVGGEGE